VSGDHSSAGGLYQPGSSILHRLPAHLKIVSSVLTVVAIVATPREQFWAFGLFVAGIGALLGVARIRPRVIARRLVLEIPFLVFAAALPFVALGERTEVLGLSLSVPGLYGAWNILIKGTLGVLVSTILASTTSVRDLLGGLQRLRVPDLLIQIMSFMARYAVVVADQMRRMRIARESRAFSARHLGHAKVVARSGAALFIRSYERGERVHLAMLARGYSGRLPAMDDAPVPAGAWLAAFAAPAVATAIAAAAIMGA
jgi:cobalt/nickel transport system permease protein